ncbi:MAG: hypothetical protein HQ508_07335 [Candidatus Marinimicrobia bacterium]|nr:hypothetical protein [Candidatus Neomarinimicrobiota bacterium]
MIRILLAICLFWLGGSTYANQEQTLHDSEEEVYLSFRYQGVIDEIIVAIAKDGEFYLPLTELFELFAINYELSPKSFSVSGYYLHEKNPYIINFSMFKAVVAGKEYKMLASEFLVKDVDFFVKPEVFQRLFEMELTVDMSRLILKVKTRDVLPIISRHEKRRAHERRMQYTQVSQEWYPLVSDRTPRLLNGVFADYTFSSTAARGSNSMNLQTSFGGELLYGDLEGRLSVISNQYNSSLQASGFRWRYVDDKSPWFTRAHIGALSSSGLNPGSFVGVNISNEPTITLTTFDQYIIDGQTDPDAEVELYQNNRLVEVSKADEIGYYRFYVPLSYGISRFKIRIYAKQGHVLELDREINVPYAFLPPGEFRYQLSGGARTSTDPLNPGDKNLGLVSFTYGVNNWLSAKTGVDYIQNENEDRPLVYNQISSRLSSGIMLNLKLIYGSMYQISSYKQGNQASSWNMEYTYFEKSGALNPIGYIQTLNTGMYFPIPLKISPLVLRFDGGWQNFSDHDIYSYNLFLNHSIRGYRMRYGWKEEHGIMENLHTISSSAQVGLVYSVPRNPVYHPLIRGTYFRSDLSYSSALGSFENLSLQISRQLSKTLRVRLTFREDFILENSIYEIGISWDAEKFRSVSSVKYGNRIASYEQSLRGSAAFDRTNGDLLWDNRQQVGRAGASIRMFIDENNSGTYEFGEEVVPGNAVSIQRATARQINKSGITRLSQLEPYRRYNFVVNEAKISNPLLLPRHKEFSVVLDPNSFKTLDIPFYTTGIIDGRVDKQSDGVLFPVSGLRVHIKQIDGPYQATLRTFSDGSYYSMEIPPGDYEAWVDESQLEFLGMLSTPDRLVFSVQSSLEGDYVEALDFTLE